MEDQLSERELSVEDGCASVLRERAQSRDRVIFRKTQPVEDQLSERELSVADGCAGVLPERAQSRDRVIFRKTQPVEDQLSERDFVQVDNNRSSMLYCIIDGLK